MLEKLKDFYYEHETGCKIVRNIAGMVIVIGGGILLKKHFDKSLTEQKAATNLIDQVAAIESGMRDTSVTLFDILDEDDNIIASGVMDADKVWPHDIGMRFEGSDNVFLYECIGD